MPTIQSSRLNLRRTTAKFPFDEVADILIRLACETVKVDPAAPHVTVRSEKYPTGDFTVFIEEDLQKKQEEQENVPESAWEEVRDIADELLRGSPSLATMRRAAYLLQDKYLEEVADKGNQHG